MNDAIILEARSLGIIDKPRRANSKIWQLPEELFCDAIKAHLAGISGQKIRLMLEEAGIPEGDLPSHVAWWEFWQRFKPFLRLARRQAAVVGANAAEAEARKSPAAFDDATLDLVRQLTFELADSDLADPKDVSTLVSLLLKHKDQQLKERQVNIAERRVALAEQQAESAKSTLHDDTLTPDEREQKMREIFGLN